MGHPSRDVCGNDATHWAPSDTRQKSRISDYFAPKNHHHHHDSLWIINAILIFKIKDTFLRSLSTWMHLLHFLILENTLNSHCLWEASRVLVFLPKDYHLHSYHLAYWSGCTMFCLSFTIQWGHGETGTEPERSKMMKWLENWSLRLGNKKRPRDWRLFSLEKKSLKSHLIAFKRMKGSQDSGCQKACKASVSSED